jgi:hypothetical protein
VSVLAFSGSLPLAAALIALLSGLKAAAGSRPFWKWPLRAWLREFVLACLSTALVFWLLPAALEAPLRGWLGQTPLGALAWVLPLALGIGWGLITLLEHAAIHLVGPGMHPPLRQRCLLNACLVLGLAAGSCLSGSASLLLRFHRDPPRHLPPVEVWFLADGGVHCLRPWTGRPATLVAPVDLPENARLVLLRDQDAWHLGVIRPDHSVQVLQAEFAPAGTAVALQPAGFTDRAEHLAFQDARLVDCFGPPALLPPSTESGLRVRSGRAPSEGLTATTESGLRARLALAVPLAHWEFRCVSVVEEHWVFFQVGPQLGLWDLASNRVHALARGTSPLVLRRRS